LEGEQIRAQESLASAAECGDIEGQLAFHAIQAPTREALRIRGKRQETVQRDLVCGELRQEAAGAQPVIEPGKRTRRTANAVRMQDGQRTGCRHGRRSPSRHAAEALTNRPSSRQTRDLGGAV
jgi:hypothetical protein